MKSALIFMTIIAVGLASNKEEITEREIRGYDDCIINGRYFANGEIFVLPGSTHCIKYVCRNGRYEISEEGCELNNQCYDIGSTSEFDCTTYRCEKSRHSYGYMYRSTTQSIKCKDATGACHTPGDRFPYILRGRYYHHCTCSVNHDSIWYSCRG